MALLAWLVSTALFLWLLWTWIRSFAFFIHNFLSAILWDILERYGIPTRGWWARIRSLTCQDIANFLPAAPWGLSESLRPYLRPLWIFFNELVINVVIRIRCGENWEDWEEKKQEKIPEQPKKLSAKARKMLRKGSSSYGLVEPFVKQSATLKKK